MEKSNNNMSINKKQIEILTTFMSSHHDLAKGILITAQGRKTSGLMWEKLTESLNTEGPPQKQLKEWKKTWSDLKYKVKNKLRNNKVHLKGTGGGLYMQKSIDEFEEKIIECVGLEAAVGGISSAKSFGVRLEKFDDTDNNNSDDRSRNRQKQDTDRNTENKSLDVWDDIVFDYQNENIVEEEPCFEYAKNSTKKRNANKKIENKQNLMKEYVMATNNINTKLDAIHGMLHSISLKVQKRKLELEGKHYRLKKRKMEIYEKNQNLKLRLEETMLNTKIEENRIRLQEIENGKFLYIVSFQDLLCSKLRI